MRYTRLRRAIESGTLIGTHGTPFQGGADKAVEPRKKRKKMPDDSDEEDAPVLRTPTGGRPGRKSPSKVVKSEELSPDSFNFGMNLATPSKNVDTNLPF